MCGLVREEYVAGIAVTQYGTQIASDLITRMYECALFYLDGHYISSLSTSKR